MLFSWNMKSVWLTRDLSFMYYWHLKLFFCYWIYYKYCFIRINYSSLVRSRATWNLELEEVSKGVAFKPLGDHRIIWLFVVFSRWLGICMEIVRDIFIFMATIFTIMQKDKIGSGLAGMSINFSLMVQYAHTHTSSLCVSFPLSPSLTSLSLSLSLFLPPSLPPLTSFLLCCPWLCIAFIPYMYLLLLLYSHLFLLPLNYQPWGL